MTIEAAQKHQKRFFEQNRTIFGIIAMMSHVPGVKGPPSRKFAPRFRNPYPNLARYSRWAYRSRYDPGFASSTVGFRVASVPNPDAERTERPTGEAAEARDEPAATQGGSEVSGVGTQNK